MAVPKSKAAVVKAIGGNAVVTVGKAVAALASGSGAMVAETIHSLVDTLNQCLLLIGHQRSMLKATPRHPYGFGPEANFWGLLAAIGILVFGGGISVQHGLHAMSHPHVPSKIGLVLGVLAFATAVEAWVLLSVLKGLAETRADVPWVKHIKSQGPGTITVVLEDAAAVVGCLIAALAIGVSVLTGDGIWDAMAQLTIGAMLISVGLYLVYRNRGVLIGQAIPPEKLRRLNIFVADLPGIDRVSDLKTRMLTAHTFMLKAEVVFSGGELAQGLMEEWVERLDDNRTADVKTAELLGRFADRLFVRQAELVDTLEQKIRDAFPGAVHIDLEPHLADADAALHDPTQPDPFTATST